MKGLVSITGIVLLIFALSSCAVEQEAVPPPKAAAPIVEAKKALPPAKAPAAKVKPVKASGDIGLLRAVAQTSLESRKSIDLSHNVPRFL